ncbi:MAG: NIL domain-containing protein [Nostoc sp.]
MWGRTKQLYSSLSYLEKLGLPIWLDFSSVYSDRYPMTALNNQKNNSQNRLLLVSSVYEKSQVTLICLWIHIPKCYLQAPVISQLISTYSLVVNITKAMLQPNANAEGCFDIELRGTVPQISSGLAYLEFLNFRIVGKPNADGDS